MTDIFHEVEEDLRREKLNQLWSRYGTLLIILAVAIVLGTAGMVYWKQHTRQANEAQADALSAASETVQGGNAGAALQQFSQIASQGGGYGTLAMFRQAGILVLSGDVQGAVALYDKISHSDVDNRLKAIARLRAADAVEETEAPEVLKGRVADLAGESSPWRYEARDIMAYADMRAGKLDDAAKAYAAIVADPAAPSSMRERARQIASYIQGGAVPAATAIQLPPIPEVGPPGAPGAPAVEPPASAPQPTATSPANGAKAAPASIPAAPAKPKPKPLADKGSKPRPPAASQSH